MATRGILNTRTLITLRLFGIIVVLVLATTRSPLILAQNVTVRVTIEEIKALTVTDGADEVDWYAVITIGNEVFDNEDQGDQDDLEGNDQIFPNWKFDKSVPLADGSVPVTIRVRDEDGLLKLEDDNADINPFVGQRDIHTNVELTPCFFTAPILVEDNGNEVAKTIPGVCREGFRTFSNHEPDDAEGDGRAAVQFKIEVLNVGGLLVRCTHTPLWPKPGDDVTLKVEALDNNINLRTADSLNILREGEPDNTASSAHTHSLSFTPSGDSFVYGCEATIGNNTVSSGMRRVRIGNPPSGDRAVEVVLNTGTADGIDILLVPDEQDYPGGASSDSFREHAANVIYDALGGFYSEPVFLERQNQINFHLAMDSGNAKPYDPTTGKCPHVAPANRDTKYGFAESAGIIHTDTTDFRNCASPGQRLFSATPPLLQSGTPRRVAIHEAGHRPFGLQDEYCNKRPNALNDSCDGGYSFQTQFFPNVFSASVMISCEDDLSMEKMQNPDEDLGSCETWTDDRSNGPFSTYDPVRNDLMNDRGRAQFLDRRRIEGVLDHCVMGGC